MPTTPTTVSTCTLDTYHGKHVMEIFRYSEYKAMLVGDFIRSGSFSVGGFDWAIRFYPTGLNTYDFGNVIAICLEFMSCNAKVWASCQLSLVDQTTGLPSLFKTVDLRLFALGDDYVKLSRCTRVARTFEASPYLRDDHLTIQCTVTVKKPRVSSTEFLNRVEAPPSNITEQLGELLDAGDGADVAFSVGGETFKAHKVVLAMRSPVFRAQLYGPMEPEARGHVVIDIDDMQPAVFRAFLHFVYTDSLPDETDQNDSEMIYHLFVAADVYAVDRMKLVCESILCNGLNEETVSTTLALAHRHNCHKLKDFCLQFITSGPNVMDAVVATQGYKNLKATCGPAELSDIFGNTKL